MRRAICCVFLLQCGSSFALQPSQRPSVRSHHVAAAAANLVASVPSQHSSSNAPSTLVALPDWLITGFIIACWYGSSIVCNQSSKVLLSSAGVSASGLTLAQFCISSVISAALLGLRVVDYTPVASVGQWRDTALCAVAVTAGFGLLNSCVAAMHVSLVMVLRAAEPVFTLLLAAMLLPRSALPSSSKAMALVAVVAGAGLSSAGAHSPSALGLALVAACNVCFAARGILSKRLAAAYATDACSEFFHLSVLGAALQALSCLVSTAVLGAPLPALPPVAHVPTLLRSGAAFFAYNQLSWVCLARMSAVSHSLFNSLRRPATVVAALAYNPMPLAAHNVAGLVIACLGALLYGML